LSQDGTATNILSFHGANQNDQDERLSEVYLVLDEVDLPPDQFAQVKTEVVDFLRRRMAQPVSILWIRTDGVYTSAFSTTNGYRLADDIASSHVVPTVWKFRVPDRGSVNPSPLGDGSWFVLALEDCQRGFFVVARQAAEPNLPYLGEGPCLQSAAWPINPASSRNRSHRLLGGGAFTPMDFIELGSQG